MTPLLGAGLCCSRGPQLGMHRAKQARPFPFLLNQASVHIAYAELCWLSQASRRAILNANYMASRLKDHYKVLYTGKNGTCAHEFIIDLRPMKVPSLPGRLACSLT